MRRWKKSVTRKEKQQKYSIDERMILTRENKNDFNILLALYFYRALSSDQIHRMGVTDMKKNTLWSKMTYLTERKVIKTIVDHEKPTGSLNSKFRYILTELGLQIILDALNVPPKKRGVPKQYYSLMDLRLGSQKKHHYLSVDWVTRVQQIVKVQGGILVPDSEWRRYFNGDPNITTTIYKPDWIMYQPHIVHDSIMGTENYELHPFVYPLTVRDEVLTQLYKKLSEGREWNWRNFYKPMLVLEMDTGSMNHRELDVKYQTIVETLKRDADTFPKLLVFCNYVERFSPRFNEEKTDNVVLNVQPNSKKRLRNTRKNLSDAFHKVLLEDELFVIHGDEYETMRAAADYIINQQEFIIPNRMSNIEYLLQRFSKGATNLRVFTPASEEGKAWRDLSPYGAGLPDLIIIQDADQRKSERFDATVPKMIDFVYFARCGWVNPQRKAATFQNWLQAGGEWPFVVQSRVVMLYPNADEFQRDVFPTKFSQHIYFGAFDELEAGMVWRDMYIRLPVVKKGIRWERVSQTIELLGEEEEDE